MKKQLLFLSLLITTFSSYSISFSELWTRTNDLEMPVAGQRKIFPNVYQLAKLNTTEFQLFQQLIPEDENGNQVFISLPTPNGQSLNFRVFESSMMEKPLADKYPMIKTYTAIQTENPLITAKLDFTVFGFHAKVFNGSETYFIDPYTDLNTDWYIIYYKHDFSKPLNQRMHCDAEADADILPSQQAIDLSGNTVPQNSYKTNGLDKRTYRLALACTIEYSAAVGGASPTKASVLSAMVTSMNRVNGVFEKDFSMHANLVANNDTLIFLSGTDPYTNNSGSTMLGQNQTTINARIGTANYDYGHVFSTGGGGIASLGSVCGSAKAQGVTGSSNPVGDPFDIDYVAHEMGHQFGGSHTFNSVTGSCSGNRSSSSAYEIGSATTIMGYAGICGTDDIQQHSDDYYHIRSLEQMTTSNVMTCATTVSSNNAIPTLGLISATYNVPYRTPFEFTASGTDPDNNPLTYCWEEWDRGGSGGAWDASTTVAPIFRSFNPSESGTRVFPTLIRLLQNQESYKGELLPTQARTLRFRCTLRDNNNGYGAFYTSTDTLKLNVVTTPSLFRVTSQPTATNWTGWTNETITWDPAGTTASPIMATNVNIYMSSDSGKTWAHTIALNTPNDGSEVISVPNVTSQWCRIKVKASDNVFFDLNDGWLNVTAKVAPASIKDIDESSISIFPNPAHESIRVSSSSVNLKNSDLILVNTLGQTILHTTVTNSDIQLNVGTYPKGIYFLKIKTSSNQQIVKRVVVE